MLTTPRRSFPESVTRSSIGQVCQAMQLFSRQRERAFSVRLGLPPPSHLATGKIQGRCLALAELRACHARHCAGTPQAPNGKNY